MRGLRERPCGAKPSVGHHIVGTLDDLGFAVVASLLLIAKHKREGAKQKIALDRQGQAMAEADRKGGPDREVDSIRKRMERVTISAERAMEQSRASIARSRGLRALTETKERESDRRRDSNAT
jgi:hypothetical protein